MKKFSRFLATLVGGALLSMFVLGNMLASAAPTPPEAGNPTDCAECQTIQDDLDQAFVELALWLDQFDAAKIETLLADTTSAVFADDNAAMTSELQAEVELGNLLMGESCGDSAPTFSAYSTFTFNSEMYCFENPAMLAGENMEYIGNFYNDMTTLTDSYDEVRLQWEVLNVDAMNLLIIASNTNREYTQDQIAEDWLDDLLVLIDDLITQLEECEDTNCPVDTPADECPDCATIATQIDDKVTEVQGYKDQAATQGDELDAIDEEITAVEDKLMELEALRDKLREMVKDAGGMTDADCDDFQVGPGQAWGIAHNFGDVQWCFTNEGQIEEMIKNLDEYWATNKSSHLPAEEKLQTELDDLMNQYFDKLNEYIVTLDMIDQAYDEIERLVAELEDCIEALQTLQDSGACLDQDIAELQKSIDDANAEIEAGYEHATPGEKQPPVEETPPADEGNKPEVDFGDVEGHWAEDHIADLAAGDVVSGDADTGNFRPDETINRAEAAKIVSLAQGDEEATCDATLFPDVIADSWFCTFVTNAKQQGYFSGYEDGTFGPGNEILRAEAAAVVLRALDFTIPEYDSYSFPDITGDEWYADYAERAYACGIFEGRTVDGEKIFAGDQSITRAEFAKIINVTVFNSEYSEAACS